MNNFITDDLNVVYYVIKVNGQVVSQNFSNQQIAEMEKMKMPTDTQMVAEVVAVNANGQQILLG